MRTVNDELVGDYADRIRPLLPLARTAYGTQAPDSPARRASDEVNDLILEYADVKGGNLTHLARELGEGDSNETLSLAGLRRRLRSARRGKLLGSTSTSRKRGSRDPELVKDAAHKIRQARNVGSSSYGEAVRDAYRRNISLTAVAKELDVSYYTLWVAGSNND